MNTRFAATVFPGDSAHRDCGYRHCLGSVSTNNRRLDHIRADLKDMRGDLSALRREMADPFGVDFVAAHPMRH
jgi:hypothetical protein